MLAWAMQNLTLAALLAGLVWLLCHIHRFGPATRHALWLVVMVKLVTPPLVVWPWAIPAPWGSLTVQLDAAASGNDEAVLVVDFSESDVATPAGDPLTSWSGQPNDAASAVAPTGPEVVLPFDHYSAAPKRRRWFAWLPLAATLVWATGSLAFALLQAVRIGRTLRRVRSARPADDSLLRQIERMSARLKLRPIRARLVSEIGTPFVWAIPRATLCWPAEPPKLSVAALQGLVVHELAHVKRRDHWVGWLELAAGCLWWWNPLFWYVRHQLRENAELACDAWVVGTLPQGRRAYAEALLAVCECISKTAPPMPAMGVSRGSRRTFERRLTMIMRDCVPACLSRGGLLAAMFLAITALPAWSQKPPVDIEIGLESEGERVLRLPQAPGTGPIVHRLRTALYRASPDLLALPPEAKLALEEFEVMQAAARREAEQKIGQGRQALIRRLETLQNRYSQEGKHQEAADLQAYLRRLAALAEVSGEVRPDPTWLVDYRDRVGQSFLFDVYGAVDGAVWGSDIYSDDSDLSSAAVHAGALRTGQRGIVRVTILPGQASYGSSTRNGVGSSSYGPWEGSYRVEAANASAIPVGPAGSGPGAVNSVRGRVGQTMSTEVVGGTQGAVWGTDIYTNDSDLATAAVHAGVLQAGQRGIVHVRYLPGRDRYQGSTRNGVASLDYGQWEGSFQFVVTSRTAPWVVRSTVRTNPNDLTAYRDRQGQTVSLTVTGSINGSIWGTDVYTDDSDLATAAVHAGLLQVGTTATVDVTILPCRDHYSGSTKNGVSSYDWQSHGGSYRIAAVRPASKPTPTYRRSPAAGYPAYPKSRELPAAAETVMMELTGTTEGTVWGTDVYTDDSSPATAAVHAGALQPGERGTVKVTYLDGRDSYSASTRNGVSSHSYGTWSRSFRIERAANPAGRF